MTDLLAAVDDLEHPYRRRSVLADLALAREGDRGAARRLTRAGLLRQAPPGSTLTTDIAGLLTREPLPISARARRLVDARTAGLRRLLDAVVTDTLPTGSRPWLPEIPAPTPGEVQHGEKTSTTIRKLTVDGALVVPDVVTTAADLSWSTLADGSNGDILAALVLADALAGVVAYIVEHLAQLGAGADSLAAAVAAVEGAGWEPDLIVSSRAALAGLLEANPQAARYGDVDIVFTAAAEHPVVLAKAGTFVDTSETDRLQIWEPHIGGFELAIVIAVAVAAGEGAVAVVGDGGA
jgi:hypothetical protein